MSDREMLLWKINMVDFSMFDLHLFLDTHPNDADALALFQKYSKQREVLAADFTMKYGPLNTRNVTPQNRWEWIANPWPWDYSQEV